ncbi:MAG: antitoxin [Verrucomicrobia bacterium]|nr:antitoxin [Verrucomicrobiota bacterium]
MRTTVTLDPDTEALLKAETARTGLSFKEVLNRSIRRGLAGGARRAPTVRALFPAPFPAELAQANFNHLADAWDDEETLRELQK